MMVHSVYYYAKALISLTLTNDDTTRNYERFAVQPEKYHTGIITAFPKLGKGFLSELLNRIKLVGCQVLLVTVTKYNVNSVGNAFKTWYLHVTTNNGNMAHQSGEWIRCQLFFT